MTRIEIVAIERQARQLRAEEMRRLSGILAEWMNVYLRLLGRTLVSLGSLLSKIPRPLFSSNPRQLRLR